MISQKQNYFLLTRSGYDNHGHYEIHLYGVSQDGDSCKVIIDNFKPLFFVPTNIPLEKTRLAVERKKLKMLSWNKETVDCLYFKTMSDATRCYSELKSVGYKTYESDIYPVDRYLMERMVKGGFSVEGDGKVIKGVTVYRNPRIRGVDLYLHPSIYSIDIETNGYTNELYSIASVGKTEKCFIIGNGKSNVRIEYVLNEKELLQKFTKHYLSEDPDIITGWNVIGFDLNILQQKCQNYKLDFLPGRDHTSSRVFKNENSGVYNCRINGRIVIDGINILRANSYSFESFSLGNVASEILGERKLIEKQGHEKIDEINEQFKHDKESLAEYNIKDAELVKKILDRTGVIDNAVEYARLSGRALDNLGGSVASFDHLYLPLLHREGYVAKDKADVIKIDDSLPGGFVIEPEPGIYENVLLLDFKSLYPTLIMTFMIDPLGEITADGLDYIKGPAGPAFSRKHSILPGIIEELYVARNEAKRTKNEPLSYSIKILMNSFYGVLGSSGCRFFAPDLAKTITRTGQYILKKTIDQIEKSTGYKVIYGDTDSLFVFLGEGKEKYAGKIGNDIVSDINYWMSDFLNKEFHAESKLELEFETHFRHLLLPSSRHGTHGSKKRYCGTISNGGNLELKFKGMESARTDWTLISQEFQQELYKKVFLKEEFESYIHKTVNLIREGKVDEKLVYKKHIRKPLDEYTTHIPPHVQAAKLLNKSVRRISYVITVDGPQPVEKIHSALDYEHYIETQIKPVADSILHLIDKDFDSIISGQTDLFG